THAAQIYLLGIAYTWTPTKNKDLQHYSVMHS
mgnify:CR=1